MAKRRLGVIEFLHVARAIELHPCVPSPISFAGSSWAERLEPVARPGLVETCVRLHVRGEIESGFWPPFGECVQEGHVKREDVHRLIDRIGVLRHACDLDLLVFFARHPRTLLTSEQIAAWLGYELKQIADSLELLMESGLLTRTQNPARAARMYVFVIDGTRGGWLRSLLELASSREGRLAMIDVLSRRAPESPRGPAARSAGHPETTPRPRPFVVRRKSPESPETKAG